MVRKTEGSMEIGRVRLLNREPYHGLHGHRNRDIEGVENALPLLPGLEFRG